MSVWVDVGHCPLFVWGVCFCVFGVVFCGTVALWIMFSRVVGCVLVFNLILECGGNASFLLCLVWCFDWAGHSHQVLVGCLLWWVCLGCPLCCVFCILDAILLCQLFGCYSLRFRWMFASFCLTCLVRAWRV